MKPNTAGIAARIMKYPVYRPLIVAGSAAITGHSLFGDSRIDLTRSTSFAVSITRLLPSLALAWNVLVVVARMMAAAPGGSPKRSEEHTSELQSLMRLSYHVFCLR